jgi:two-component system nitrate/nitrite response regulator NarL
MRRRSFATVIAGPSALIREGITRVLSSSEFRIVASTSCLDELLLSSLPDERSLLLIIDIGIDAAASVEQVRLFKERYPAGRIAVLADRYQLDDVLLSYRVGANAYLVKISACDVLLKSLELVMLGETILPEAILPSISSAEGLHDTEASENPAGNAHPSEDKIVDEPIGGQDRFVPQLSAREKCILRCLLEGDANKVIARKVDIAEATVKVHVKAILRKIRVQNRTQAAIWAMNHDLLGTSGQEFFRPRGAVRMLGPHKTN